MKVLKQSVIDALNNVPTRRQLAIKLNRGEQIVYKHTYKNKPNNRLTKADAVEYISEILNIPVAEVCEDAPQTA